MKVTAYIIVNALLFSSWYVLLFRQGRLMIADRITGSFILGLSQIIATEMLLGVVFEQLYPVPLFLTNFFISCGLLVFSLQHALKNGIFRELREETARVWKLIRGDLALLIIFILFATAVLWSVVIGYLFPSYTWDALYYHLPIVGQIMQSGAIREHIFPSFIQQYINVFSKNINLFFLWNVIFLGSDVIVDLSQLVFSLAAVVAVYSMAVKLGIREKSAIYSSLLFFFAPVIILQSTANYVDCAVSVLFIIALNFLMYDDKEKTTPLLLSGLASGILLGSKPTGPLFFAVLIAAFLLKEALPANLSAGVYSDRGRLFADVSGRFLVYFILPALLIGGYWYIRNWIIYGNPVYYMDVSLFGTTLFSGLESDWVEPAPDVISSMGYMEKLWYVWKERVGYYMYDSRLSGFGPLWFILFLPSITFSLVYGIIRKRHDFLFMSIVFLAMFILHPRNWTTRYVIFIIALGAVSFGMMLDLFGKRAKMPGFIAVILAGYTFFTMNSPCIMPEKIMEFVRLPAEERTLTRHKPFNIDTKVRDEYGYWIWIERNIQKGDTLAITFTDTRLDTSKPFFLAPLWNSGFSNRVVYVEADTYERWLKTLDREDAGYVLLRKDSIEDRWVEKERKAYYSLRWMGNIEEKFRVVYADENYRIVKYTGED